MKILFIILILINLSCYNLAVDGPDVISADKAYDKFFKILFIKVYTASPDYFKNSSYNPYLDENTRSGCLRDVYLYTDSVDYCEQALWTMNGNPTELLVQFLITLDYVCDLKKANFLSTKKPLQGELRICAALGMVKEDSQY